MPSTSDFRTVNSLTYADVAGLQLGLARLPGEETPAYVDRLYRAAMAPRDHSYEGMLDELVLELGLTSAVAGSINVSGLVTVSPGLVTVDAVTVPTAVLDGDSYLHWRTLGEVFADLGTIPGVVASLVSDYADRPAVQLARQGNVFTVINEPVQTNVHPFGHAGVVVDSLRFNRAVGPYTVFGNTLALPGVSADLAVSYQYRANPFDIVISDVGLFALADPALASIVVGPTNVLAYQIREYIQAVMRTDRSYWSK